MAVPRDEILRPFLTANVSTENFPFRSVAVVTIGSAPMPSAILWVSRLQPPMWPESRAIAHLPCSSMQTTAGSLSLLRMKGAMCLTAMPVAPTKTMASHSPNARPVHSRTLPSILSIPRLSDEVLLNSLTSSPRSTSPTLRAVAHPLVENATMSILMRRPSRSPP